MGSISGSLESVKRFQPAAVLWVLALWMLAMNHCRIERVLGVPMFECCEQASEAPGASHDEGSHSDAGSCLTLELSLYKSEQAGVDPGEFQSGNAEGGDLFFAGSPALVRRCETLIRTGIVPLCPRMPWAFLDRAAASARAPASDS